jgi:hypothetical protein
MDTRSGSGMGFMNSLLQKFQNLNSARVSNIFSAASIKLANYREKKRDILHNYRIISKFDKDEVLKPSQMKEM